MRNAMRRATPSEIEPSYALLEECSQWLRLRGLTQWNPVYPRARFEREVHEGNVWLWADSDGVAATVTLFGRRPDYYPEQVWNDASEAWYICRFAVARRLKGAGIGGRLLSEIEDEARAAKLDALRLDVTASNPFLANYYQAKGFTVVAVGDIRGGASIFLEKRLR
jgi:GNAT superfamily N-acetyltransferase